MAIVVADDDPRLRRLVRRAVERLGREVKEADGAQALLRACDPDRPEAVVSDIGLEDGDGIEASLELRRRHPGLPIVLMTADPDRAERAAGLGFAEVLLKPFALEELAAALERVLPPEA